MTSEVADFLAHAVALEDEASNRYDELADSMDVHNNKDVAVLFRKMAKFSRMHGDQVRERAANVELPHFKPWEFKWGEVDESPEAAPIEQTHYLMTPYHCLFLALHNERRGQAYYAGVAASATDPEVKRLAQEMADEESEHVVELEEWIKKVPVPAADWDQDLDPPVVVD